MNESNVVELKAPAGDALSELLQEGARQLVRDRSGQGVKFNSQRVPPYLKRTKRIEKFIEPLYTGFDNSS